MNSITIITIMIDFLFYLNLLFLSNLGVKSPITKNIEHNIFEGVIYRFYILLLFDFVFGVENKKIYIVNLNCV